MYTTTNGTYAEIYTSSKIDLSKYNSIIVRKDNFVNSRIYFMQIPNVVNNPGFYYNNMFSNLTSNIYVGDISSYTRNDLYFVIDSYHGGNAGNIYYIALSEKTVAEIRNNYSFIPSS